MYLIVMKTQIIKISQVGHLVYHLTIVIVLLCYRIKSLYL